MDGGRREKRIIKPDARKPGDTIDELDVQVTVLASTLARDALGLARQVDLVGGEGNPARNAGTSPARRLFQRLHVDVGQQASEMLGFRHVVGCVVCRRIIVLQPKTKLGSALGGMEENRMLAQLLTLGGQL